MIALLSFKGASFEASEILHVTDRTLFTSSKQQFTRSRVEYVERRIEHEMLLKDKRKNTQRMSNRLCFNGAPSRTRTDKHKASDLKSGAFTSFAIGACDIVVQVSSHPC